MSTTTPGTTERVGQLEALVNDWGVSTAAFAAADMMSVQGGLAAALARPVVPLMKRDSRAARDALMAEIHRLCADLTRATAATQAMKAEAVEDAMLRDSVMGLADQMARILVDLPNLIATYGTAMQNLGQADGASAADAVVGALGVRQHTAWTVVLDKLSALDASAREVHRLAGEPPCVRPGAPR